MLKRNRILAFVRMSSLPMLHTERRVLLHHYSRQLAKPLHEVVLMLRFFRNNTVYDLVLANDFSTDDSLETAIFFHEVALVPDEDIQISISLQYKDGTHDTIS